ncbi:aldehyde dehydrogenase family protein [Denitromonas iodatirespirans]|uniref:Aldehyde dehydrogenase family protein n=1 Tax=Denitromonas iodatirespirans TaxID=2795389 RepID=A0A944HCP4_DENI1|nr:aldehyde dehydrogenase family protein [Denitromonas iodatirespirans]MBT0962932.1 aldehyde dehydrogenase family protein [Denitromonas iodatirespirans]
MNEFKLLIGGRLVDGATTMEVIDPATGEVFTHCPRASAAQAEEAIAAARAAFPDWSAMSWDARKARVLQIADALDAQADTLAPLLTREQGRPVFGAEFEVHEAARILRTFAGMTLADEVLHEDEAGQAIETRAPLGVVAAIAPWNFPLVLLANKLGPGLMAGNTMILKPAPTTPLTTLRLGEICASVLPAGVVNVITDQNDLGPLLTGHPHIAKVAFTGSTATGRKVMASGADTLKRLTLELGGNDAALVLDDADPAEVAQKIFNGAMFNAGQICAAIKRVYVPDALYDAVCNALALLAEATVVGNGLDLTTQMGPVQNRMQYDKLKGYLDDAHTRGKVIAGGKALDRPGYFIAPTIVRDIPDDARLVREEQFGPVLPVLRYRDLDDAVARINDSEYGLCGSVWSGDTARACAVARRINSGTVWVNKTLDINPSYPFRGVKQSGIGTELGRDGLEEYTQAKVINLARG